MAELKDYNGEFRPNLKLTDFDKDVLVRLWHASARNYAQRTGEWYRLLRERFDEQAARDIRTEVWMNQHKALNIESRLDAEAMSFHDRDLIGFLKSLQWDPGQQGIIATKVELVNNNPYHGRATIQRCWVYDYCWRSGDFSFLDSICDLDLYGYQEIARWFHPHIKAVFLKGPSREKKDEIPCQWEFFIPGKSGHVGVTPLEDYSGPELKDYGGEFLSGENTDETAKKFSKETLARIIEAGGRLTTVIDGIYTSACQAKWGREVAYELDRQQWRQSVQIDVRRVRQAVNIQGDDVETLFKCYQCMPAIMAKTPEVDYDLSNKSNGVLTVKRCRSLDYCVKHGLDALQQNLCEVIDKEGFSNTAHCINPDIKVTPLKLPERQRNAWELWTQEEITEPKACETVFKELLERTDWPGLCSVACQWEFRL